MEAEELIDAAIKVMESREAAREADRMYQDSGGSRYGDNSSSNLYRAKKKFAQVFNELVREIIREEVGK